MKTETDNPNRLQELEAENLELRGRLAEHDRVEKEPAADDLIIAEKMACGLSREQAVAVIQRQRDFDGAKAAKP
jgi:hypothetical protein